MAASPPSKRLRKSKSKKDEDEDYKPPYKLKIAPSEMETRTGPFLQLVHLTKVYEPGYSNVTEYVVFTQILDVFTDMAEKATDFVYRPLRGSSYRDFYGLFEYQNQVAWFNKIIRFADHKEKDKLLARFLKENTLKEDPTTGKVPALSAEKTAEINKAYDYFASDCVCVGMAANVFQGFFKKGSPNTMAVIQVGFNTPLKPLNLIDTKKGDKRGLGYYSHCVALMIWKAQVPVVGKDGVVQMQDQRFAVVKDVNSVEEATCSVIIYEFLKLLDVKTVHVYGKPREMILDEYAFNIRETFKDIARVMDGEYPRKLIESDEDYKVFSVGGKMMDYHRALHMFTGKAPPPKPVLPY